MNKKEKEYTSFWLYEAIENNDIEYLKEHITETTILNKNLEYNFGATFILRLPLIVAFEKGYLEVARLLILKGADLDVYCKKSKCTPREIMPKNFTI